MFQGTVFVDGVECVFTTDDEDFLKEVDGSSTSEKDPEFNAGTCGFHAGKALGVLKSVRPK